MKCDKCGKETTTVKGHLGKKHRRCGGRKREESKANSGRWIEEEVRQQ